VDLSNLILAGGKGLVEKRVPCYLCGQHRTAFHITCARQAGFEVVVREGEEMHFYGMLHSRRFCHVIGFLTMPFQLTVTSMVAMLLTYGKQTLTAIIVFIMSSISPTCFGCCPIFCGSG
jgi:hypothetical protein